MNNEFQTLIDKCGLSTRGLATLLDVRFDTVRNWKYGRVKTPENIMLQLRQYAQAANNIFMIKPIEGDE